MTLSIRHRWEIVFLSSHPYGPKWKARRIARYLKCNEKTVRNWLKRYQETGDVIEEIKPGRTRKTTRRQNKTIERVTERNPELSIRSITQSSNLPISSTTIWRRLKEFGYENTAPTKKPLLNQDHATKRLIWARKNLTRDWSAVIFSDEASFNVRVPPRRVWTKPGVRYIARTVKHPVKVHIWGCFSEKGFGRIHVFTGILTGRKMCEIYSRALLPSIGALIPNGSDWELQEDNDPKHMSKVAKKWKEENGVNRMSWPAMSPDMNPKENVWAVLKSRVAFKKPKNLKSLVRNIRKEWRTLSHEYAEKLVSSMSSRVQALINASGDYTLF